TRSSRSTRSSRRTRSRSTGSSRNTRSWRLLKIESNTSRNTRRLFNIDRNEEQ
ncbi:hypothetical protein S83_046801, partial [Arachis hypogaea]